MAPCQNFAAAVKKNNTRASVLQLSPMGEWGWGRACVRRSACVCFLCICHSGAPSLLNAVFEHYIVELSTCLLGSGASRWERQRAEGERDMHTRAHTEGRARERGPSATGGMFPIGGYVASFRNSIELAPNLKIKIHPQSTLGNPPVDCFVSEVGQKKKKKV